MQLLLVGVILFLAVFAIKVSNRSGIPALLLFIILGMTFSYLGIEFENFEFADSFATLALMVIMFQGGFSTNWNMGKPVAKESIVLSFLGVIVTALLTGLFCHYVLGFKLLEGMLLGSIVGSTDFASVSNILRSQNLNLKYSTSPLLELESGSNDPTAYTMTMLFLSILLGKETSVFSMVVLQISVGLAVGFINSILFMKFVELSSFDDDGLFAIFIVAVALFTYSFAGIVNGNGYLAVYIFGIYVGNQQFKGKRDLVFFLDGFANLMQIALFFMLGLLSNIGAFIANLHLAFLIMLFMTLIARPVAVFGLMAPFKKSKNQLLTISLAGIRGAAAIAFAIMVVNSGVELRGDLYHIVFGICVISSMLQGYLLPILSKKWDMIDPHDTVLKTFNDYQDKSELGFIQTRILPDSRWVNQPVRDLNMAFNIIVAKIERNGKTVVPKGSTIIKENDVVVLGGETHFDSTGHDLVEFTVSDNHEWVNKMVRDLKLEDNELIIMLQREDEGIIVPVGSTKILSGDKLVTLKGDKV